MAIGLGGLAAIGGAFNVANSLINNAYQKNENQIDREFNAQQAEIQRNFQSKEAELAYERQVDFYDTRQSPTAMMEQYKEAGINPAVAFGHGSAGGVTSTPSSSVPSGAVASARSNSLPGFLGIADEMVSLQKSIEEVKLLRSEAREANARSVLSEIDALTRHDINNATISQMASVVRNNDADTSLIEESTRLTAQKILESQKTVEEKSALIVKYAQDIQESKSRVAVNLQSISESIATINNLDADSEYKASLTGKIVEETAILSIQKKYAGRKEAAIISELLSNSDLNFSSAAAARKSIEKMENEIKTKVYSPDMDKKSNQVIKYTGWLLNELLGSVFSGAYVGYNSNYSKTKFVRK